MGTVITVTSGKGGVGKSTVTANISVGLAEAGKKVVAVDFDIGLRNLDMILGLENRIVYDVIDVMDEKCRLQQALINDKFSKNLYFLPASQTKDKTVLDKEKVKKLVDELKSEFDYVIIDSPAGIESGFEHAILAADRALIVSTPEVSSVRDADRVIGIIDAKSLKAQNGDEVDKHIIINRLKPDLVEKGDMLAIQDVVNILALPLIGVIPDDEHVVSSTNMGEPVIRKSGTKSGDAFKNITQRILGNDVPFVDLSVDKSLIAIFKRWFQ
ncbi:MAG TPA: septum site-determining protein MinD [Campylobacterales bacterium]|nr:septum site-determining protein MinD [Campylobacterales bacterium]